MRTADRSPPRLEGSADRSARAYIRRDPPLLDDFSYIPHFLGSDSCCKPVSIALLSAQMKFGFGNELEIDSAVTLNQVRAGCDLRIRVLSGPGCERLRDMGFCEEMRIRKLSGGRNLVCSVCGSRLAISRELAEQVLVEELV